MFDARHHENAVALMSRLGVPADRRAWLVERTPFHRGERGAATSPEADPSLKRTGLSTNPASP
jgi:hypothetical protein